jgi:hypothetical protein
LAPANLPSWNDVKHLAQDAARKIVPSRDEADLDNTPIAEPAPAVSGVQGRTGVSEGNAPRPPASQRFNRLKSRVAQTLAAYQRRPLNTTEHTPWEVMHGFIAFGIPSKVRVGGPSGDPINSIGWMNSGGRCKGQVMLATEDERLVAMRGVGVQGHQAQYLAILAQCRVALNSPIQVEGAGFTVADLVEEEKLACLSGTELTFALIGLAHYLPTDAEWEFAARGGLAGKTFTWGGDAITPARANVWQGTFPRRNTGQDGFVGTAPVGSFPANGYGLSDMAGNVWEWTADRLASGLMDAPGADSPDERIIRGGSFMCHASYCTGYRVAARMHATPATSLMNTGFRCAADRSRYALDAKPTGP